MDKEIIRILLVEDDPDYRRTVKTILAKSSRAVYYHIKTVNNTTRAVECLRNPVAPGFDVIVLDLGLPDNNGTDSIKRLHRLCSGTPIIALTEQRNEEVGLQAIKHGADDYFTKDDALKGILARAIRHTIERR
ncbi:MAG: response regulator, partial [Planctomycetota bacterium]